MKNIYLKLIQPYFEYSWCGLKNCEIRKNDRDFKVNDIIFLREYSLETKKYSGRIIVSKIHALLLPNPSIGLKKGFVIILLESMKNFQIK